MTSSEIAKPRRILLGIGEADERTAIIEIAARLAGQYGAPVECLVVAAEDLLAAAGLPFTRAVGPGGLSMPVTVTAMENHFRRLADAVERDLSESCRAAGLPWRMERREGTLERQLVGALDTDDVVVIGHRDLRLPGGGALEILRNLLKKASAVIIPSRRSRRRASSGLTFSAGDVPELLLGLAEALGAEGPTSALHRMSVVTMRLKDVEAEGEVAFFRRLEVTGASAVLLPESPAPKRESGVQELAQTKN
jgi:hypothetical protein